MKKLPVRGSLPGGVVRFDVPPVGAAHVEVLPVRAALSDASVVAPVPLDSHGREYKEQRLACPTRLVRGAQ